MILVGLGGNLPSPEHGDPVRTLTAALDALENAGIRLEQLSRWYKSAPLPPSDQPWYVNAVARVGSDLDAASLLRRLHEVEVLFGRVRGVANGPRLIDLDLLDHDGRVEEGWPILPHPRLAQRAFVLAPLIDVAPDWRHPVSGKSAAALLAALDSAQVIRLITDPARLR